jgi:Mg2+ and Co2+ transporter CorA
MTGSHITNIFYALFLALVLILGMKYVAAIFQAMAHASSDKQYRILAEKAVAAQSESQATIAAMQADLSRMASSLAAVEKILQQVE